MRDHGYNPFVRDFTMTKALPLSISLATPVRRCGLIVLASGALLSSATVAEANSIPDPSFEKPAASSNWKRSDYASSLSKTVKRSGAQSLRLLNDGTGSTGTRRVHNVVQSSIPVAGVVRGKEYEFTVYVRGENVRGIGGGGKPLTVLRWRNASNGRLAGELYNWAPYGTYNFTPMKLHFQAPAGAAKIDVGFRSWWDNLSGVTYWDDANLVPRVIPGRGSLLSTYQAETANIRSGGRVSSVIGDYTGSGYYDVTSNGAVLEWNNVAGGGQRVIAVRYSWEGASKPLEVFVNGVSQGRKTPVWTGHRGSYATENWKVNLPAGSNRVRVRIEKASGGGAKIQPLIDRLEVYSAAP